MNRDNVSRLLFLPSFLFTRFLYTSDAAAVCVTWAEATCEDYDGFQHADVHFAEARVPRWLTEGPVVGNPLHRVYRRLVRGEALPGRLTASFLSGRMWCERGTLPEWARADTGRKSWWVNRASSLAVQARTGKTSYTIAETVPGRVFVVSACSPGWAELYLCRYDGTGCNITHLADIQCHKTSLVADMVGDYSVLVHQMPWLDVEVNHLTGDGPAAVLVTATLYMSRVCAVTLRARELQCDRRGAISYSRHRHTILVVLRPWAIPPL